MFGLVTELSLTILVFVSLFFIIGWMKENNSIMTFVWPLGILLISIYAFTQSGNHSTRSVVVVYLIGFWAIRLFIYSFYRYLKRGYEDFRYRQIRDSTKNGFLIKSYLQFYIVQAIFMIIISFPAIIVNSQNPVDVGFLFYLGILIWLTGFIIESVSDIQLMNFKKNNPKNAIMTAGLWKYSRHPNYFGESLVWWGIAFMVSPVKFGIYAFISPFIITLLLRFVSGVPLIEDRYQDNEEYEQYRQQTSTFIPAISDI